MGYAAENKRMEGQASDLYEFILFNIMSNVASIVNFIVLWIGTSLLFKRFSEIVF